jgi:hypothetical protein
VSLPWPNPANAARPGAAPNRARAAAAASSTSRCDRSATSSASAIKTSARAAASSASPDGAPTVPGSWDTQKWLIGKSKAHRAGKRLAPDTAAARKVLAQLGSVPRHLGGDRFIAKPRRKIPASEKPTPAMRRAQLANIKKAQVALRKQRRARA